MSEKFEGTIPSPENKGEVQLHKELQEAMNQVDIIMAEIDKVFESIQNREEAEQIVLEKYGLSLEEALKKQNELVNQWLKAIGRE